MGERLVAKDSDCDLQIHGRTAAQAKSLVVVLVFIVAAVIFAVAVAVTLPLMLAYNVAMQLRILTLIVGTSQLLSPPPSL